MSLLSRASWKLSRHRYRFVQDHSPGYWTADSQPSTVQYQEIPCLDITIPEADWKQIQQLVHSHERYNCHPAVVDAWQKYQMCLNLVSTGE